MDRATPRLLRPFAAPRRLREVQAEIAAEGFHSYYERSYRAAEFSYWGPVTRWLARIASRRPGQSLLDVGCAYGTLMFYASRLGFKVSGTDRTDEYISPRLVRRHGCRFAVHDLESDNPLPRRWGRFDVILFTEVLEHLNYRPEPAMVSLSDVLHPGGRLLLTTPDRDAGWGLGICALPYERLSARRKHPRRRFVDGHVKVYTAWELRRLLATCGFRCRLYRWRLPGSKGHLAASCRKTLA